MGEIFSQESMVHKRKGLCQSKGLRISNEESGGGAGRTGYFPDKTLKDVAREGNTKEAIR